MKRAPLVEVVYAQDLQCFRRTLPVPADARVDTAVIASGLIGLHPEVNLEKFRLGIWGRVVAPDQLVRDGDRIEIYRPLRLDPAEMRRQRASRPPRRRR